jgi:antitoxin (DNA-binding transcriptional repressor) of toxin-antitoxin stability system
LSSFLKSSAREALVVTSDGVPVLKVVPFAETRSVDAVFADVREQISWTGDIDAPTDDELPVS